MATEMLPAYDRIPPQSIEMEQAVLGAMLIERAAIETVADILTPTDFYRESHRVIFEAILDLFERDEPIEILTLREHLRFQGLLDNVGGAVYLFTLTDSLSTAANAEFYALAVREKAESRRVIDACNRITVHCHEDQGEDREIGEIAESILFDSIRGRRTDGGMRPMAPSVSSVFEWVEERAESKDGMIGVGTGLMALDGITAGLRKTDLIILAARPSMGKTALAMHIARHVAAKHGAVAIFNLEMSVDQLVLRLTASEARVDLFALQKGKISDREWRRYGAACAEISQLPIFISDAQEISASTVLSKSRRIKAHHGLELIVVDYLQQMRPARQTRDGNRVQEVAELSRACKSIARKLDVPVLVLAQLSRAVEARPDKRPQLSDLRDSGSIEADADLVGFLYRSRYYESQKSNVKCIGMEIADLIIAKHRNGPTGAISLAFHPEYTRFDNLDEHHDVPARWAE